MSFLDVSCTLFVLITAVFTQVASRDNMYVYHSCSSSSTYFTTNDTFGTNLKELKRYLYSSTPRIGFSFGSFGEGSDLAYGHALCYLHVSPKDCDICLLNATRSIRSRCPLKKTAVIWFKNCFLKYSNTDFFGHIDRDNMFVLAALQPQRMNQSKLFGEKRRQLLNQIADEASHTLRRYATGNYSEIDGALTQLFGMAQCTMDLSGFKCNMCLNELIAHLPDQLGKINVVMNGAHLISGSCVLRYETYQFIE